MPTTDHSGAVEPPGLLALVAVVLGAFSFLGAVVAGPVGLVTGLVAAVLGTLAERRARRGDEPTRLARAGVACGLLSAVLAAALLLLH